MRRVMLHLQPIDLDEAREFVRHHHRHHAPPQGGKFAIAVNDGEKVVGVVIVGRPVARLLVWDLADDDERRRLVLSVINRIEVHSRAGRARVWVRTVRSYGETGSPIAISFETPPQGGLP